MDTTRIPPGPLDETAARTMWHTYAAVRPAAVAACPEYTVERFGDSAALADELLGWVLDGGKRATSELVADFRARGDDLPRVGSHWIACDGAGVPRAILRSVELRLGTMDSVDEQFAIDEGDGTREIWLEEHTAYWTRSSAARGVELGADDEIVFERFRVVWPPELADAD